MRYLLTGLFFILSVPSLHAQFTISGTVFDSSKINYVENVRVVSTGGMFAITDSLGRYSVMAGENDSLVFFYNNKPTQKFLVKAIPDPSRFNISLRINIKGKYHVLNEVVVFSRSYKQDSLENRQTYADIYDYKKPGLSTSITPGGGVGADVDELINIFRFKRNRRLRAFQLRLETQEQEKYITYRFNKLFVKRITGLDGALLDTFLVWYRPSYEFAKNSDELIFNQYILKAFYQYQKIVNISPAKKEE
ncbi:MAG: hypothetical protein ABI741_00685 [Ferruginibacter sp.]